MKQICILSGKGGTGKSSIAASFAALSQDSIVLVDCDVDAANQALFFKSEDIGTEFSEEAFYAGTTGNIDSEQCTNCGLCIEVCRYNAIEKHSSSYGIDPIKCEGCHACTIVCPACAIAFTENQAGMLYVRNTSFGSLVHAELFVGHDNSGKLVAKVRNRAKEVATKENIETILIDGPPGIGCPVHASLTGADAAVIVTEPSVAGVHDLERILTLCIHFNIPATVIVNKYDLSAQRYADIEQYCAAHQSNIIGKIPFDKNIPLAQCKGKTPLHLKLHTENLQQIWKKSTRQN